MPIDLSFVKAPVEVPKLSGFDKSHFNELTSKCGTITPVLVDELMPGSKVNLKIAASACLPPLASDTFMRVSLKMEAFFVPMRLLIGSFESWFVQDTVPTQSGSSFSNQQGVLPYLLVGPGSDSASLAFANTNFASPGTLSDYLGFRRLSSQQFTATDSNIPISILPYLAYGKIWDDWFRAPLIQKSLFARPSNNGITVNNVKAACFPYWFFYAGSSYNSFPIASGNLYYADNSSIFALRQRNFGFDYFTTAMPSPQLGSAQVVSFATSGATGQFSIASLRASNSLQQFAERNALSSPRYQDSLRARYGVNLSSGVAQRSLLLGSASFDVYSKGIYQQGQDINDPGGNGSVSESTNNPFQSTTGARFGSASASGQDFIVNGFTAEEPGYLFVMATLVPKATYGSGIRRYLMHYVTATAADITQMANPILQNVGPQPIIAEELAGIYLNASVFGYTDRYAEYKTIEDGLHGLLRDGQSLQAFALQRSFVTNQSINSSFLEIPTNYMDQVTAVSSQLSNYGYWADFYFDYKVAMPLSRYSLPSLQDPAYEHGKTVVINKGGTRL